jgi:hypothetical protein
METGSERNLTEFIHSIYHGRLLQLEKPLCTLCTRPPSFRIAGLDIFFPVSSASDCGFRKSLDVDNSFGTGDRPPARQLEPWYRRAVAQLHQLKVLYKPIPTSVADIVRIPSCLEPYLYFDLLISIAFCCSLRFFMPVK